MVERKLWCLSDALGGRRGLLLDVPKPEDLLELIIAEAGEAAHGELLQLAWEQSIERPDFFRLAAQVALSKTTFDQFFNGRSGYRAQYYLSPEEGILYNRELLDGLTSAVKAAHRKQPLHVEFDLIEKSLLAPHSKIWVFKEKAAFDDAAVEILNPPRWVANSATRGRRVPLPSHRMIEIKGSFINPVADDLFVDELKLDRAWDLFNRGYT